MSRAKVVMALAVVSLVTACSRTEAPTSKPGKAEEALKSELPPAATPEIAAAAVPTGAPAISCEAFVGKLVALGGEIYKDPGLRAKLQEDCVRHKDDLVAHAEQVACVMKAANPSDIDGCKAEFFMKW